MMTYSKTSENSMFSCPIFEKPRRNQLTAHWLLIDGKLTCKWFSE